jgi:hypothetical protein
MLTKQMSSIIRKCIKFIMMLRVTYGDVDAWRYNPTSAGIHIDLLSSRSRVVGIATKSVLDDFERFRAPEVSRIFSTSSRPALGSTHPLTQRVPWAPCSRGRLAGAWTDHSLSASVDVKHDPLIHTPFAFNVQCLIS